MTAAARAGLTGCAVPPLSQEKLMTPTQAPKKLVLKKETIQTLNAPQPNAQGGSFTSCFCTPTY